MLDPWLDENGEFIEVVAKPRLHPPFHIWEDPWCDLTFLRGIFKNIFIPPYAELADSGLGDDDVIERMWKKEWEERKREEKIERKRMKEMYPELRWWRQKKKGRTLRRRTIARQQRFDKKYEEEIKRMRSVPRGFVVQATANYDEHVMKMPLPNSWKVLFWLLSFIDDNRDYKFLIVDKTKEVFYPAEPIPKRTLGYELLELMTPDPVRRSASMWGLERKRTSEVTRARDDSLNLRRSKSETDLNGECAHWNLLVTKEELASFDDDRNLYIQLVECERQDDMDQWGVDFYYTF